MSVSYLDWAIIGGYFIFALAIGIYFSRRAGSNITEFFGAGRSLPWWLAGTSMVATTFSADTPLAVTEMVYAHGIAGNWLWWNFVFSGILTVFFFARLWRRVGVLTDIEFTEVRYSGRAAGFLRGFRALYFGIVINAVIMGWVISAIGTVVEVALGIDRWVAIIVCLVITVAYSALSGLWGVIITDFFQFIMAMAGSILLAVFALGRVGGMDGVRVRLAERFQDLGQAGGAESVDSFLSFIPPVGSAWLPVFMFFGYIAVQWWASWYPGAEPGGGGYVAQRMFSARDEKHSLLATLWFNVAHYALRPWPWIITALVAVVLFPKLEPDKATPGEYLIKSPKPGYTMIKEEPDSRYLLSESPEGYRIFKQDKTAEDAPREEVQIINEPRQTYVALMMTYLPKGVLGLLLAAMAAAFMSTISTHINWGTSYVVRDFYQRFIKRDADEGHYVSVSRWVSVFMMVVGGLVGFLMQTQVGGWKLLLTIGAGTGLVLILRWFWWRINALSEISSMIAALVVSLSLKALQHYGIISFPENQVFAYELVITVVLTTAAWLLVTFLTRPEKDEVLDEFFRRARPAGPGWKKVRERLGDSVEVTDNILFSFLDWIAGCVLIYAILFGVGDLIMGNYVRGIILTLLGAGGAGFIYWDLNRRGWQKVAE
ncbi:MAG: sodium:solute symporter family protein [bacterium]